MRRIIATSVLATILVCSGSAQFLQLGSGYTQAITQDYAAYYDSSNNLTFLDHRNNTSQGALGVATSSTYGPWQGTYTHGVAASTGEYALSQGTLTNNAALNSVFNGLVDTSNDLTTTFANSGPYYGVSGYSNAYAVTSMTFNTTQATSMFATGNFIASGQSVELQVTLFDETASHTINFLNTTNPGSYSINGEADLVSGDEYVLTVLVYSNSSYQFDPTTSFGAGGPGGATGYFTANFLPAPEPISFGLLGFGALALLRRRK